jgi:hypothetical protein
MHTISARQDEGFKVKVYAYTGEVVHSAWYADRNAAQGAAEHWERLVTLNLVDGAPVPTLDEILSDDELLTELML